MDSTRSFQLPGIQDLNKEQEDVMALPSNGQYLVVGGPGTGKSVVALLRARKFRREKIQYVFLVYNHLLDESGSQLYPDLISITWIKWFKKWFKNITKQDCPLSDPLKQGGFRDIDWIKVDEIASVFQDSHSDRESLALPHLIIDEGQDMPPQFYQALCDLGFEHFFIVADQNQQIIANQNSSRRDIETYLALESEQIIELHENFRNTLPTARLAQSYCPHDPASPKPQLPDHRPSVFTPILFQYSSDQFLRLIRRIIVILNRDPRRLIGIITPNNAIREKYIAALESAQHHQDPTKANIQTYYSGFKEKLHFDKGGIMVINVQSCKGLEFDDVFLADTEEHQHDHNSVNLTQSRFYVMVSRARKKIILLRSKSDHKPIDEIHPKDPLILKHYPKNNHAAL